MPSGRYLFLAERTSLACPVYLLANFDDEIVVVIRLKTLVSS
jgi:hypothetical protein